MKEKNTQPINYSNILKKIKSDRLLLKPNNDKNLKLLVGKFVNFTNESLESPEVGASIRWFLKSHKKVRVFSCIMEAVLSKDAAQISIEFLTPELQAKVLKSMVFTRFCKNDPLKFIQICRKTHVEKQAFCTLFTRNSAGRPFKNDEKSSFSEKISFAV